MRFAIWSLAALALAPLGCATTRGDFTRPNYDTIYAGQQAQGVYEAIGRPWEQHPDRWVYEHENPFYKAEIVFGNGKVLTKKWTDNRDAATQPAGESETKPKPKPRHKHHGQPSTGQGRSNVPNVVN